MSIDKIKTSEWAALLGGADYGEAYLEDSSNTSIQFENSRVEEISSGSDRGVGLRYLRAEPSGNHIETIFASANSLDPAIAAQLRKRLLQTSNGPSPVQPLKAERVHVHSVMQPPEMVPFKDKIALLASVDKTLRDEYSQIRQISLTYGERSKTFQVINSEGVSHRETRKTALFAVRVTAEKNGLLQTGYEVIGGLKGFEILSDFDPVETGRIAARRAASKLDSPPAKAGEMPVILASAAGGTFVHEAIGHSLEADHVQEGTSPAYRGKIGQVVAKEFLNIIDDPSLPFCRGSYLCDDEGIEARPTWVVENGVLKGYLYDRITALKDKTSSNAHGRRESYHHKPIPRMSNLYIAPGKDDPAEILKTLDHGLLVTRMGGGQVDTATGEFIFEVEEGFWVENGKVRHMVRDANLLGVGPEVLRSIDRLGWDIGWGIGTCGKEGQGVPVSDGQPTLRIPKLLIGGRDA